jgi:hypothetical protein
MGTESMKSASPQILVLKYQGVLSRNVQAHFPVEWSNIIINKNIYIYIKPNN